MEGEGERTGGKGKERDGGREAHTYARTLSSLKILVKMFLLVSSGRDIRFSEGNKFTITEKFSRPNRIKKHYLYISVLSSPYFLREWRYDNYGARLCFVCIEFLEATH